MKALNLGYYLIITQLTSIVHVIICNQYCMTCMVCVFTNSIICHVWFVVVTRMVRVISYPDKIGLR